MDDTGNKNESGLKALILIVLIGIPFKLFLMEPYSELADSHPVVLFSVQSLLFAGLVSYLCNGVFRHKDSSLIVGLVICSLILGYSLWQAYWAIINV